MNTLANGHRLANVGQLKGTDSYNPELMAVLDEIKELKKQLKIAQEEREILKKATAYFANEEG
jgi:transposase